MVKDFLLLSVVFHFNWLVLAHVYKYFMTNANKQSDDSQV